MTMRKTKRVAANKSTAYTPVPPRDPRDGATVIYASHRYTEYRQYNGTVTVEIDRRTRG
jgi:hypothetical protein